MFAICRPAVFLIFCMLTAGAAHAQGATLYTFSSAAETKKASQASASPLARIQGQPAKRETWLIDVDAQALNSHVLNLPLPGGQTLTFTRRVSESVPENGGAWGGLSTDKSGFAALVNDNGNVHGKIVHGARTYVIESLEGRRHAFSRVDMQQLPPAHGDDHQPPAPRASRLAAATDASDDRRRSQAVAGRGSVIDVMVLYTKTATLVRPSTAHRLKSEIESVNLSLTVGGIPASFQMVELSEVSNTRITSVEGRADSSALLLKNLVAMPEILDRRNALGADIVVLVAHGFPSTCGQSLGGGEDDESKAYVFVNVACLDNYTLLHELGHIFGAGHERSAPAGHGPFPYGRAHIAKISGGRCVASVMASSAQTCNGLVLPYFSSPTSYVDAGGNYLAQATGGTPLGEVGADNRRVVMERAAAVAAYRNGPNDPRFTGGGAGGSEQTRMRRFINALRSVLLD